MSRIMYHLGSFESSLRCSDGGKKYAERKRKENYSRTLRQALKKENLKKSFRDGKRCSLPNGEKSLTDSTVEVDQKIIARIEVSIDESIVLIDSDNEKCANCKSTKIEERHETASGQEDSHSGENPVKRSKSWEMTENGTVGSPRKQLKIRGPLGSLVNLNFSAESERTDPSEQKLLKAIDRLSAKGQCKDKHNCPDDFEQMKLEEFVSARVSTLFEKYQCFPRTSANEEIDFKENIENLLNELSDLNKPLKCKLLKSVSKEKKKPAIGEIEKRSEVLQKTEETIRSILPGKKVSLSRGKKNISLDRFGTSTTNEFSKKVGSANGTVRNDKNGVGKQFTTSERENGKSRSEERPKKKVKKNKGPDATQKSHFGRGKDEGMHFKEKAEVLITKGVPGSEAAKGLGREKVRVKSSHDVLANGFGLEKAKVELPLSSSISGPAVGQVKKLISDFERNLMRSEQIKRDNVTNTGQGKFIGSILKARTEEELANEKAWLDAEKLWLVHRDGFTSVKRLPNTEKQLTDAGKVKVVLEKTEEIIEVDEDDLEKANPNQLDKVEDISHLRYINESSVLYLLRQRYGNNLIHTYAAGNLIVINPQCILSIYNEKVAALFRGCKFEDMPPHIYATAQTTYRSMLASRKDQSIVLIGRSGSGKTHNFRHILHYLLHSVGSTNKVLSLEKLNGLNTVLEAFGNARTCLNVSATRCTNVVNLDFDQAGQIASLSVQILMLEKQRVVKRPEGEGTFNVFHWLLAGAEGSLAKQLLLDTTTPRSNNLFIPSICKNEDRQRATMELAKLTLSLQALGVSEKECFVLWSVLAAIFHLGNAGAVRVGTNKWQFADPVHASRACKLLGTTTEDLVQVLWCDPLSPSRAPSPSDKDKTVTGIEALEGFVVGLYSEIVNAVNNLINRCLTTTVHTSMSLVIVDSPGLQNPGTCGQQRGATFSDLCHNYVQERFHLLFHNVSLVAPHDRYTQENVEVNTEEIQSELGVPTQLVSLLDKSPPSGVLKTSQTDLREIDRRGLLWLLDEETLYPNSSDETFRERLFQHYSGKDHQNLIRRTGNVGHFIIQHLQGTNPVLYNGNGLLKASKENPLSRTATSFLQESTKEEISRLFLKGKNGLMMTGGESSQSLRRVSSIRRTCSVVIKRKSIGLQVKFTMDSLIETLRRTRPRFVFCMLPQHNAGNTELIPGSASSGENVLNVPLLRSQMRGAQILPAVRLFKQGFPECFPHGEFKRRFKLLAPGCGTGSESRGTNTSAVKTTVNDENLPSEPIDESRAVEEMLLHMDVDVTTYRIGLTQVFFRAGILAQLESQRDEKLADLVIQLQSRCRGYLARKKLAKMKVQDLAVRCIQRNVRKLMHVREWSWWRLYVKITPLLNVHRTEEELSVKIQELEDLKATLERLETERNHLKLENDRLESKLSEMTMDLSEERAAGTLQAERLEAETAERVRLEQELSQIQSEKKNLQQTSERLEMELFYARADVNGLSEGEGDPEDGGGDAAIYKNKCERALRELEFTRRRLQQQHEDDLEQLVALKKQLEKKLADAYEEVDEQRQVAGQWKRKVQKLQSEMNDLRLLLEVQSSRNNLLEKKQRKFDSEIQILQEELRAEKNQKDHLSREKEMAVAEKYSMEQSLSSVRLELELKDEKLSELSQELEELSRGGGTEQEITQLRKAKHDLEMKLKEQEEELDELAGQVSMLEGNKLRLEMSLESLRKEHRREIAQRDDELDEARSNAQKKNKVLESQLESEHEERTLLLREKHELERRLANAEEKGRHSKAADEDALQRARRDLKKTKALLRDAQVMLERAKQDSPSKAALRALKNQLEDAELARASAVKAKQSLDSELNEVNGLLEEALRNKGDAENRCQAALREMNTLRSQVDENEEELAELLKKYRQAVQQLSAEQLANQETAGALAEAEAERQSLRDQLAELTARLEANAVADPLNGLAQKKLEIRIKELESRLDLEQTTRSRLEVQISRLKENVERLNEECVQARTKEQTATDLTRKLQRSLREAKEDLAKHLAKEQEAVHKRKDLEKRLETAEQEASTARTDLRLALKRIEDLQLAISGEIASDSDRTESYSEEDESGDESLVSHVASSTISSTSRRSRTPDMTTR